MVVATVEAIRRDFSGRIGIVRYRKDREFPVASDATVDLSRYFAHGGARQDELRMLLALLSYRTVALLGADVLDGFYSDDAVRLRLRLVDLAAQAGANTVVLGFSFNATPSSRAVEMLSALPRSVRLLARDGRSHERLSRTTGREVERVADAAFLLCSEPGSARAIELHAWAGAVRERGGRVLGVNLSAVAMEAARLSPAAAIEIAARALQRVVAQRPQTALVLIPHDVRGTDSDVRLLTELFERLEPFVGEQDRLLLASPLSARFVKDACACFDLVWTGRMHLAIAALGQGVPTIAHEYQGKFGGLFHDLGLTSMLWPPTGTPLLKGSPPRSSTRSITRTSFARRLCSACPR